MILQSTLEGLKDPFNYQRAMGIGVECFKVSVSCRTKTSQT